MKTPMFASAVLLALMAACSSPTPTNPPPPPPSSGAIAWSDKASEIGLRGKNGQQFSYTCFPNGTAYPVFGTDLYTDESSICTAGVHAGKITLTNGGTVTIEIRVGAASYTGSTRNGITSGNFGVGAGSFIFP
jgi:LCCL domain